MSLSNQAKTDLARSHRKLAGRYYYAIGIILLLLGVTLRLLHHVFHQEGVIWEILGEFGTFLALIVTLHFLYELLIKKDERQLFISDLENVMGQHLKEINNTLQQSRATIYPGQAEAYAAVAEAIVRTSLSKQGEKALLLAALHGHSGKRRTVRQESDLTHESFANQMYNCILSSGPGMWYVRELYNITDEDRLQMVMGRIEKAGNAEGYEVRAFCLQNVIPQLTPLVIGDEELFIGWDDPTYYGVRGAVHIRGQIFARTATEYFDSLWNDKRAFVLRSGIGIETEQINSLRAALRVMNASTSQPAASKSSRIRDKR